MARLPAVREKSGKNEKIQGQGKVREFDEESGKNLVCKKVREKSGNFEMAMATAVDYQVERVWHPLPP